MPDAEADVNRRQKAVLGLLFLVMAAVILFPPWVEVLRDDPQERHVVFLGRGPLWDPPPPTRNLENAVPNPVERDRGAGITDMLSTLIVFGFALWFLRTREP